MIKVNRKLILLIKFIITISIPFLTILVSTGYKEKYLLISFILSLITTILIIRKIKIKDINTNNILISLVLSLFTIKNWLGLLLLKNYSFLNNNFISQEGTSKVIGLLALPALTYIIYLFIEHIIPIITKFFKGLKNTEKIYLIIMLIISIVVSFISLKYTTAFSKPYINGDNAYYDVLFTTDTGCLVDGNTFYNVSFEENDIRQPLFGVLSLPFSIPISFLSTIIFFMSSGKEYVFLLTILQFILTTITTIMIARMINIKEKDLKYYFLFVSLTSTYILFNIIIEQYVIALFYLVLALYYNFKNPDKINYTYIGAVGSLLTSGIIFPLITKFKDIKQWIKDVFKVFITFISTMIIFGQSPRVLMVVHDLSRTVNNYTGKTNLLERLYQYTNFIKGIFYTNSGRITEVLNHPSYQSIKYTTISITGIIILLLCILGYYLNRNKKIAKISILWILFSFILLFIIGYGTEENGLILYSLYFGWAFISLIYLAFDKLIKNRKLFKLLIIIFCISMIYFNIDEIINIFNFAIKYY